MRIAVIGLLPAQARMIKDEFRGMDIRVAHKDTRESATRAATLSASADRILVMRSFVGHAHVSTLDRSKTTLVDGGMSSLRKVLRNLDATHHALPRAQRIEPMADKHVTNEFSKLAEAKVGDVLVFQRPPNHSLWTWAKTLKRMKTAYKNRYGVEVEIHEKDDKAEFLVTAIGTPAKAPKQEASAAPSNDMDRRFWQEVFLQSQKNSPGARAEDHAEVANAAIESLSKRFGGT